MIDFETLLEAYMICRKNKRNTVNATEFEMNYVGNLLDLLNEVNSRQYKIGKSICFVVSYPRYREVFAAQFRDRILHHYIALRLEPLFEAEFNDRTYNCRVGRGQLYGVAKLKEDIRQVSENYTQDAWILKIDLKGFFMSIGKTMLADMVDAFIVEKYEGEDKEDLRWICSLVIMHHPELDCERRSPVSMWKHLPPEKSLFTNGEDKGVAIGNLFAQLFANFLLNGIDWKIDGICAHHGRYVDDIAVVDKDKKKLLALVPMLRQELAKLGLRMNEKKFYLQHYTKGVQFTGAVIKCGRVYAVNTTVWHFRESVKHLNEVCKTDNPKAIQRAIQSVNSYLGILIHYNEYATRRRILSLLSKDFFKFCYIKGRFRSLQLKWKYTERYEYLMKARKLRNKKVLK